MASLIEWSTGKKKKRKKKWCNAFSVNEFPPFSFFAVSRLSENLLKKKGLTFSVDPCKKSYKKDKNWPPTPKEKKRLVSTGKFDILIFNFSTKNLLKSVLNFFALMSEKSFNPLPFFSFYHFM